MSSLGLIGLSFFELLLFPLISLFSLFYVREAGPPAYGSASKPEDELPLFGRP